jgi:hypothetical protein
VAGAAVVAVEPLGAVALGVVVAVVAVCFDEPHAPSNTITAKTLINPALNRFRVLIGSFSPFPLRL